MKLTAILIDFDGTLMETEHRYLICANRSFKTKNINCISNHGAKAIRTSSDVLDSGSSNGSCSKLTLPKAWPKSMRISGMFSLQQHFLLTSALALLLQHIQLTGAFAFGSAF